MAILQPKGAHNPLSSQLPNVPEDQGITPYPSHDPVTPGQPDPIGVHPSTGQPIKEGKDAPFIQINTGQNNLEMFNQVMAMAKAAEEKRAAAAIEQERLALLPLNEFKAYLESAGPAQLKALAESFKTLKGDVKSQLSSNLTAIKTGSSTAANNAKDIFGGNLDKIDARVDSAATGLKTSVSSAISRLKDSNKSVRDAAGTEISNLAGDVAASSSDEKKTLTDMLSAAQKNAKSDVKSAIDSVQSAVTSAQGKSGTAAKNAVTAFQTSVGTARTGVGTALTTAKGDVSTALGAAIGDVSAALTAA